MEKGEGRKAQRKVSLTLSRDEWKRIEASEQTIAAYLQSLMNKVTPNKEEATNVSKTSYFNHTKLKDIPSSPLSRREAKEY